MSRRLGLALAAAALASLPLWLANSYYVNISSQILIWGMLALSVNVLAGYAGLVSLGHAGLFGMGCYAAALASAAGMGGLATAMLAIAATLAAAAIYALLSLRASGISFLMITLALGQILWGIAYRWISLTQGDNGINLAARPAPFGLSLESPEAFYLATLAAFLAVIAALEVFVASPFGVSLCGTRDQPRRMTALGYHVWLIRFLAFLFSGLVAGLAGLFFLYYDKFVSPHALSLSTSAEALLMVIAGGTGTLVGPVAGAALVVIMKYVVSAYVERWNMVLGAIFVAIVLFMPEGLVPGCLRLWRAFRSRPGGMAPLGPGASGAP